MKKVLLIIAAFNASLIVLLVGLYYLASTYPFRPGDLLFDVQNAAENQLILMTRDPLRQTEMHFDLVERRLSNISMAEDAERLELAVFAYDRSLSAAIRSIKAVEPEQVGTLYLKVENMLTRTEIVLSGLDTKLSGEALARLEQKIQELKAAATGDQMQAIVAEKGRVPSAILGKIVPFFEQDVDHGDFPMTGGHQDIDCQECHLDGTYAYTPSECNDCHSLERDLAFATQILYAEYLPLEENNGNHYSENCADCHGVDDWTTIQYDHGLVNQCVACHAGDLPQEEQDEQDAVATVFKNVVWKKQSIQLQQQAHYPGDCSNCHTDVTSWESYEFDHETTSCKACHSDAIYLVGSMDGKPCEQSQPCQSCHSAADHDQDYPGDCTNCHNNYDDWMNVAVDHSLYPDCYSCHAADKPDADHYSAQCSVCHSTDTWQWAFVHTSDANCKACHAVPEGHSDQQCSTCHSIDTWKDVRDHSAGADCASCHKPPEGHYPGQCDDCHSTDTWTGHFNHKAMSNCSECHTAPFIHYSGECSNCHNTVSWDTVDFDHTGLSNCQGCHAPPGNHYTGTCTTCHSTETWTVDIDLLHLASNCQSCHPAPDEHFPLECTVCHTTSTWVVDVDLLHRVFSDCVTCHMPPTGHWPGECTDCHKDFTDWLIVEFDHTTYTDCKACHTRPSGHDRGQCSRCHTTDTWEIPDPTEPNTGTTFHERSEKKIIIPVPRIELIVGTKPPVPVDPPEALETPSPIETPVPNDPGSLEETPEAEETPVPAP